MMGNQNLSVQTNSVVCMYMCIHIAESNIWKCGGGAYQIEYSMWIESFTNFLNITLQFATLNTYEYAQLISITYASLFMKVKWSGCASSKSACVHVITTGQSQLTVDACTSGGFMHHCS